MLWDRGRGGGYLSLFMTGSDSERVYFTNPAQPRRIEMNIIKLTAVTPQGKKRIYAGCYKKGTVLDSACMVNRELCSRNTTKES